MRHRTVFFIRHGHRTPARPTTQDKLPGESGIQLWQSLLPRQSQILDLDRRFQINREPSNPVPSDIAGYPFGCLTERGMRFMQAAGSEIRRRGLVQGGSIYVQSTNYQRTQLSAQCFLAGLLSPGQETSILVQPINRCPMSFYDGKPIVARRLVQAVQVQPLFVELELAATSIKQQFIAKFPNLCLSSSRFDWFGAFDYFICRSGHDIPLCEEVSTLETAVLEHVVARYQLYLSDRHHLATFAVPLLECIVNHASPESVHDSRSYEAALFSGHDVNLLGVLYALGAEVVNSSAPVFWPNFGAILAIHISKGDNPCITLELNGNTLKVNPRKILAYFCNDTNGYCPTDSFHLQDLIAVIHAMKPYVVTEA